MPSKPRAGRKVYVWEMEEPLRARLEARCIRTGKTMKEELTEALLLYLEQPEVPSAKMRAAQLNKTRSK